MAFRVLDGSGNTFRVKTTLKVVPGADDNFAIGFWSRCPSYDASVFPRAFSWRTVADPDQCQSQVIVGNTTYYIDRRNAATIAAPNINGGAADGLWRYTIARCVSVTNFRDVVLNQNGTALTLNSSATDITALDTTAIAELQFGWNAASAAVFDLAEMWIAAGDPFKGLTDVPRDLVYQLAYNGPFSNQAVAGRLQFYASFEDGINLDKPGHYLGAPPLSYSAGVSTGSRASQHPQLAPGYLRPAEPRTIGMV